MLFRSISKQQPFPFASPVVPFPQQQQQEEEEEDQTGLYFDDWDDAPAGPVSPFPEPPAIASPYDSFTALQDIEEEEDITEVIPTVVTPVQRSSATTSTTSAITTTTSHSAVNHNVRSIWDTDAPTIVQG